MEETASRSGNIGSSWRRIEAPARLLHTMCGEAKGCDMVRDSRVVASAMLSHTRVEVKRCSRVT
jgi:hypothetical protein